LKKYRVQVHSKFKAQNSRTFKDTNMHFSGSKIIDKKPYLRRGPENLECSGWTILPVGMYISKLSKD